MIIMKCGKYSYRDLYRVLIYSFSTRLRFLLGQMLFYIVIVFVLILIHMSYILYLLGVRFSDYRERFIFFFGIDPRDLVLFGRTLLKCLESLA